MDERAAGQAPEKFVAWPGWPHLRYAALLSLANGAWFACVYGGADALTARHGLRVPIHFGFELRIPFVPAMTVFYMSLYGLLALGPFVCRTRREFRAVIWTLAAVIAGSGIGFLVLPADLAFPAPPAAQLGVWAGLYRAADALNLTYNLLPSLHVALAVVCAAVFAARAPAGGKVLLWSWAALIAASTVLIHQHHLLDVAAGWLLAVAGVRMVFRRLSLRSGEAGAAARPLADSQPGSAADRVALRARAAEGALGRTGAAAPGGAGLGKGRLEREQGGR